MPVIRVSRKDLERLVGKKLSDEDILYLLPRLKCEVEVIEDDVIEYEATHDRPDMYSVEGLARGIRYMLGIGNNRFLYIDKNYKAYSRGVPKRPFIAFAIVKNVELDDEALKQIMQLQEKLATTYGRGRRKASIGVYDLDKFTMPIHYELRDPEKTRFIPLNGDRPLSLIDILRETEKGQIYGYLIKDWKKYPVIRDARGKILSMPPIINGEDTKVTVETKNILIDSTGIDRETVIDMVTVMATSIAERSRDRSIYYVETIIPNMKSIKAPRDRGIVLEVWPDKVNELLGTSLKPEDMVKILQRMGYELVEVGDNRLYIETPPYRLDIHGWVDIAEDIAIGYGYGKLGKEAVVLPPATHPGRIHPLEYLSRIIRNIMISYGYIEVANYMMSNPYQQLELFGRKDDMIKVVNPKMDKYTGLRLWLTPGLLEVVLKNIEKEKEIRIFEVGDVVIPDNKSETGGRVERRVGIMISHDKATLTDGLAIVNTLLKNLGLKPVFRENTYPGMLPERSADIFIDEQYIGFLGEIHPRILYDLGIPYPVVTSEIILNNLLNYI